MSYVRGWAAHYSDGSIFTSTLHKVTDLPLTGMQIWMIYFVDGTRRIMHGNDRYFFFDNGSVDGVYAHTDDPAAEIAVRYPGAIIIEGEFLPDETYSAILQQALKRDSP